MIKWQLLAEGEYEPPSRRVLDRLGLSFEQADEDIRSRVADTDDIPLLHGTMQLLTRVLR
jgi:hypothetical protein